MANTYKDIVITPFRGDANNDPVIKFSAGDTTSNSDMNVRFYSVSNGTLSFEGSAGQLFSVTNDLSNTIFSVNDVSGIPLIEVNVASQQITFGQFYGNVGIGTATSSTYKLDVNGNANVNGTLATSSRGITKASMPAGTVLQVATVTKTDVFSTGSSSFVDVTGLSVSITPTSSSSKILVLMDVCLGHDSSGGDTYVQLLGGSNVLGLGSGSTIGIASASYPYQTFYSSLSYLDSPATTSSVTYKVQVRIGGGTTAYVNRRGVDTLGGSSSITVMEIAV